MCNFFLIVHSVPMTGRRRFMDVSIKQEEMMSREAYNQVIHQVLDALDDCHRIWSQSTEMLMTLVTS